MGEKPQSRGAVGAGMRTVEEAMVCGKEDAHEERRGSLLGEEMGLGNLSGHCGVQCLSIGDGCWMVTRGLEVCAAEEELGWEVLHSSCAAESLCV